MKAIKNNYAYVLKSIKKDRTLKPVFENLNDKTYVISGGSRGIGYNIAKKLALQGANVVITGKTQTKHPKHYCHGRGINTPFSCEPVQYRSKLSWN